MTITEWRRGLPHLATLQCEIVNRHSSMLQSLPAASFLRDPVLERPVRARRRRRDRPQVLLDQPFASPVPSIALGTGGVQPPG